MDAEGLRYHFLLVFTAAAAVELYPAASVVSFPFLASPAAHLDVALKLDPGPSFRGPSLMVALVVIRVGVLERAACIICLFRVAPFYIPRV